MRGCSRCCCRCRCCWWWWCCCYRCCCYDCRSTQPLHHGCIVLRHLRTVRHDYHCWGSILLRQSGIVIDNCCCHSGCCHCCCHSGCCHCCCHRCCCHSGCCCRCCCHSGCCCHCVCCCCHCVCCCCHCVCCCCCHSWLHMQGLVSGQAWLRRLHIVPIWWLHSLLESGS